MTARLLTDEGKRFPEVPSFAMAIPSLLKYSNGDCAGFSPASDFIFTKNCEATVIHSIVHLIQIL